jgi:competence protein ComEC
LLSGLSKRPAVLLAVSWAVGYALAGESEGWGSATLAVMLAACLIVIMLLRVPGKMWIGCLLVVGIAACYYRIADERNVSGLLAESRSGEVPRTVSAVSPAETISAQEPAEQASAQEEPVKAATLSGASVSVSGTIATPVTVDGDRVSFAMRVKQLSWEDPPSDTSAAAGRIALDERMQVSIRLLKKEEQEVARAWKRGDAIELSGATLREPSTARNFGGFDYRRYLRMQRIHWQLTVKGLDGVRVSEPDGFSLLHLLRWNDQLRQSAGNIFDELYPGTQAGFMKGLIIGLREDLDPQSFQQFSQLGLTHILAISGLHVAIFVGGCLFLLRRAGLAKETALLVSLCLVPLYIVFTGASPSVVRAGLMAMIALFAAYRKLLKDGLNLVCIVGVLMLLWNPYYIYDVSFQLSFLVTIGLIVYVPRVSRMLPIASKTINSAVTVTIVSQLASFPLSIYYFNQYSLISWLANLFLVPALSFLGIPLGSASLALGAIYAPAGQWAAWPAYWLNRITFWTVEQMSGWSSFHLIWPTPSVVWILLYYALLEWICREFERRSESRESEAYAGPPPAAPPADAVANRETRDFFRQEQPLVYSLVAPDGDLRPYRSFTLLMALACFAGLLFYGFRPDFWEREGRIHFIDVGQGDAILIHTPQDKHILVDGGGTISFRKPGDEWKERGDPYEVGRKLLVPLLKKRGVHKIDYLILTHEDADHYGGVQAVVEQIPVQRFIFNGTYKPGAATRKLFETVLDKRIPLLVAEGGRKLRVDDVTEIEFLLPFADERRQLAVGERQNGDSVVFLLRMYDARFLFTGDMEKSAENALLRFLRQSSPSARPEPGIDVLKVAHHGSKTSTTDAWLDYWRPRAAVVSVGENNLYGHPNADVIRRLKERGTDIFRTDRNGEVLFRVTKQGLRGETKFQAAAD